MKTIKYIVSLAAVCMLAMSVTARTFEKGEKIYVNVDQSFQACAGDNGGSTTTYYIKHPWNNGSWTWQKMDKCGDSYVFTGQWGNNGANINTKNSDDGSEWYPKDKITGQDGISTGTKVKFSFTPTSGNKGDLSVADAGFDWSIDNAKLYLFIMKKENNAVINSQWLELKKENGAIYSATIPQEADYNLCVVVRKSSSGSADNWNDIWTQTGDIAINEELNCIYQFWEGGVDAEWYHYTPAQSEAISFVKSTTEEVDTICKNALGGPYALHVKLNKEKTKYAYNDVLGFCWFYSTDNKKTWQPIAQNTSYPGTAHDAKGDKDITNNILPSELPEGTIYYYLYSSKAAGRRLIKLTTDGAKNCDLDCTITFFGVATSEVNANDTTYTLDGMIAFGEPCGDLVITCDDKEARIKASEAHSPQTFSIPGLKAAITGGTTTTAYAKFEGGTRKHEVTVNIPNATQGIVNTHLDVLVGETSPLKPNGANYNNEHKWFVEVVEGGTKKFVEKTEWQGMVEVASANKDTTVRYMYKEFNPPAGDMNNLMSNGSYEDDFNYGTKWQKSLISDYEFWGKYETTSQINFYTDTVGAGCINPNKRSDNGFAVVKNANNFFYTFAKVTARDGSYLALFDAASDGVADKKAWYTNTQKSPKLKLQKGTTYLFSFWAANINNYGEMDNAAKLQFQIEYNGQTKKLGEPLDLNSPEFRNNRWHQCSATFYADADATNVTISVVNLNTNTLNTGNDFALDDIQFRAVSSATRSVRIQQVFEVQTHEPAITKFTATPVQMNCDGTEYSVKLHIEYCNQISKIIVKDITDGANRTVWTKDLAPLTNGSDQWDKPQKLDHTVKQTIAAGAPLAKERKYKVYFEKWTKATKTVKFNDPVIPMMQVTYYNKPDSILPCGQKTYSISGTVTYRNMDGEAYAWIDDAAKVEITRLTLNSADELTATFTVPNVPADSAEHKLHVSFEGRGKTCPFEETFRAAFAPVVEDVKFIGVPATLDCDSTNYKPQVQVRTSNHRNAELTIEFDGQTPAKLRRAVTSDVMVFDYPSHPVDGGTYSVKAYFDYVHSTIADCEDSASFTAPVFNKCPEVITLTAAVQPMECDETSYDVNMTVEYLNPKGNLVIKDETGKTVYSKPVPDAGTLNEQQTNSDITIHVDGLKPAEHEFKAYFEGWTKSDTALTTAPEFSKCCTDGLMFRKWDNVLFVNNHDSLYVAYQWYKNDVKLEGDTLQRLYTGLIPMAGTTDKYYCELTLADGTKDQTCKHTFDECPSSAEASQKMDQASVSVRPTRVAAGAAVTVSKTTEEAMTATLRTVTGQLIRTAELRDSESTMLMPNNAGIYLLQLQGKDTNTTVKIHVY